VKEHSFDVAIIGGGPAGSTCGSLLMKYNPGLRVVILEREQFPRDHVGESQLPPIGTVLHEMGCWDKIERAGFPIKVGATYRWGQTTDLWNFEFVPFGDLKAEARPARFEGQRTKTAFQVDRAQYDKILLDHAKEMGCRVREETTVRQVQREGDRVTGLLLGDGTTITARHYVDCSGHTGVLRRAMGVEVDQASSLQNIAIWDYWQNAEWAVNIGVGGTRVQVMSLGYGWIWFIPMGPTRTSIGLVVPASYYKQSGKRPADLYLEAIQSDPVIAPLISNATSEGKLATTKDWSFVSDRLVGENWFLAGESAGFADPILAAGMTLAHSAGRDVAYTILALDRRDFEPEWLRERYDDTHRRRIQQHIRFADFWYTANGCFTDLKDFTAKIAEDAGLKMDPDRAWQWLGTGGFVDEEAATPGIGGYNLTAVKEISGAFLDVPPAWEINDKNLFDLNLEGAERIWIASLANGRITRHRCYRRGDKLLPNNGYYHMLISILKGGNTFEHMQRTIEANARSANASSEQLQALLSGLLESLEAMVQDGWVKVGRDPAKPGMPRVFINDHSIVQQNREATPGSAAVGSS